MGPGVSENEEDRQTGEYDKGAGFLEEMREDLCPGN